MCVTCSNASPKVTVTTDRPTPRTRVRVHTEPCAGYLHTPDPDEIVNGKALCPACGRMVAVKKPDLWARHGGYLAKHGYETVPFAPEPGVPDLETARRDLRIAAVQMAEVYEPYMAAVQARQLAVLAAFKAGVRDEEIAETLGMDRPNVQRMRRRMERKERERLAGGDGMGVRGEL